jgi:hypothetical protein
MLSRYYRIVIDADLAGSRAARETRSAREREIPWTDAWGCVSLAEDIQRGGILHGKRRQTVATVAKRIRGCGVIGGREKRLRILSK